MMGQGRGRMTIDEDSEINLASLNVKLLPSNGMSERCHSTYRCIYWCHAAQVSESILMTITIMRFLMSLNSGRCIMHTYCLFA
jgi:hypothetical protein